MSIPPFPSRRAALHGIWVPLVTPFADGALDLDALQAMTSDMLAAGVHGLVVCGTTGEAASLDLAEQTSALMAVLEATQGRRPVLMGVGGSDTRSVAARVQRFDASGVAGFLISAPAYVRPSQAGIVRHFEAAAAETSLPIVLYNIPARTGVNIDLATVSALSAHTQFCAIKEAGGDLRRLSELIEQTPLNVLCGDDALLFAALCAGAHGAISAAAHIRPDLYVRLFDLIRAQRLDQARVLFQRLLPMIRLLFSEPNPAPLKAALAMRGALRDELRLPMTPVTPACRQQLGVELEKIMALPRYTSPAADAPSQAPLLGHPQNSEKIVRQG